MKFTGKHNLLHTAIKSYLLRLTYDIFKATQAQGAIYWKTVIVSHSRERGLTSAPLAG